MDSRLGSFDADFGRVAGLPLDSAALTATA